MYKLEYLSVAINDILEAEDYLYGLSPPAADIFAEAIKHQMESLLEHPLMYRVYEENEYFRCMPLPYEYLCFYRVDDEIETIRIYRVLRGMRDLKHIL